MIDNIQWRFPGFSLMYVHCPGYTFYTDIQKIINHPAWSKIPKIHKFAIRGSQVKESFIIIWNISSCNNPLEREKGLQTVMLMIVAPTIIISRHDRL